MFRAFLCFVFLMTIPLIAQADLREAELRTAAKRVDDRLHQRMADEGVTPAPRSNDAEFCRRVWLDVAGVAPPVAEIRVFLADTADDKREKLIDRLLRSSLHAKHMATRWNQVLLPPDAQNQLSERENVAALQRWLHTQFRDNVPYDYLVGGFLTAGGAGDSGPAIFYTSHSLEPAKLASATSQIFLGIQLQCAQCHDHPFDRWTQKDFWRYAAFFSQLKTTDSPMPGVSVIEDRPGGEVTLPETDTVMAPRYPGASEPPEPDPGNIRRRQLTIWMASRDNPYFARAAVNRAWHHLFGRGIVDPVDQMDAGNQPSHPALLDELTELLIENRFDMRTLYAVLARTEAYGRTSRIEGERPPEQLFAAMMVKTLTAEQFYDSLLQNIFRRGVLTSASVQTSSPEQALRQQFLDRMRSPGADPGDYPHGVVQALGIMHGPEISLATNPDQLGLLASLEAPFLDDPQRIETLFLATLSRLPTADEKKQFLDYLVEASGDQRSPAATSDLLWVLLNTAQCAVCP